MPRLCFCPATAGGYGIVHTGADIPGSQLLMASSSACGRHISISSYSAGYKDRISFYVMDESEVILGTAEDGVVEAASEIIRTRNPRILLIYVCCSTFISGLDNERLRSRVLRDNPGAEVLVLDMNPVAADSSNPPAVATQRKILGLLDFTDTDCKIVNLLGSDIAPDSDCELYPVLKQCGVSEIRHLTTCTDYDDFLRMGRAGINLVLSAKSVKVSKEVRNAESVLMLPTYSIERGAEAYGRLFGILGVKAEIGKYMEAARKAVDRTSRKVRGMTISVGSTATERPFGLARSLHEYGFDIRSVFHSGISGSEKPDMEYLLGEIPSLEIHDCRDPSMSGMVGRCGKTDIAIGFNAAYFTSADHSVDMVQDMGLFGFHGICRLMEMIENSLVRRSELVRQVEDANLVI